MRNIIVFASGSGSNFQSIIDATESGLLTARITGLVSNKDNIGAIDRANSHAIPHVVLDPKEFENEHDYVDKLLTQLKEWQADLIVLAGYMRKIPDEIINSYPNRILNIHPSLLPKYGGKGYFGLHVHEAVIKHGESESGCTVHLVSPIYDEGPILGQSKVEVLETDTPETLAKRVLEQEHKLYPQIIEQHIKSLNS